MSNPLPSSPPPRPSGPRLPSIKVSGALAAVLFALGIALGAAVGPAPQSSVAGPLADRGLVSSVLPAVLAARSAASRGASAANSSATPQAAGLSAAPTSTPPPAVSPSATPTPASGTGANSGASSTGASGTSGTGNANGSGRSGNGGMLPPAVSNPTLSGSNRSPGSTRTSSTPATPAPIEHVWLVVLPGQGFASTQTQPSPAPYLAQLVGQGTLLSAYTPVDADALGTDAALLSGRGTPQLSVLTAPGCHEASSTCPAGSPAGLAAADSWLREVVPRITASADYREGGLLAIAFAASTATAQPTGAGGGATGTSPAGTGTGTGTGATGTSTSPTGADGASATTLATQPPGVLLLSPFLRGHGESSTPFHPAAPLKDLERLFRS
jgi:hypothetical protein